MTVEVALRRPRIWRTGVTLLVLLAWASLTAWVASRTAWPLTWQLTVGIGGSVALLLLARSLLALPAGVLAYRAGRWTFAADAAPAAPAPATEVIVEVALDLDSLLLLRLVASDPAARPRMRWLAAERHGVADRWQALRCAVYAPRPAASTAIAASPAGPLPE